MRRMRLAQIELSKIDPNKDNPRGINIQEQDPKLARLKDSIDTFGVLVPIVVAKRGSRYLLVDGERRFWAAKALQHKNIPAYVDESGTLSADDILIRMFQIHHTAEQWGPIQQCRALEGTYRQVRRRSAIKAIKNDKAKVAAIVEALATTTGIEERTALNRVYFLRWPRAIKSRLYDDPLSSGPPAYWYICEIEEKIIIPSVSNYPEYFETVPVDEVRTALFEKLEAHSVDKSTEVRKVAPFFRINHSSAADRKKVVTVLKKLHQKREMTYAEAQDEFVARFPDVLKTPPPSPRRLLTLVESLERHLQSFDFEEFEKAKRRGKATPKQVLSGAKSLQATLAGFIDDLLET